MKSLQEHLDNTPEEQLQAEWEEIVALGLEGPDALEYARLIQLHNPLSSTDNCGETLPKLIIPPQFFKGDLEMIQTNK
jgi:hypothetical protein